MTVAELIAKLQELPQDMSVYVPNREDSYSRVDGTMITSVGDWDYEEYINYRGTLGVRCVPNTYKHFDAVVLA